MNQKIVFISWTPFGRHTELLGKSLNAKIFYIGKYIKFKGILWKLLFPVDYILKTIKSFQILIYTKPSVVFTQNPPSIAPVVIVCFSKLLKFKTVIDSHNGAFEKPWLKLPFHIWALRNADIVTIHNDVLFRRLSSDQKFSSICFRILNSKLSQFPEELKRISPEKYFLIISSFSDDEPMDTLMQGLQLYLTRDTTYTFKITGNYKKDERLYYRYSTHKGIEFLGFVDDKTYDYLLCNAYGVVALSTRDDVQQFALMESVGAEIPFISNINLTNKELFDDKMVLVEVNPGKIADGIEYFIKRKDVLNENIHELKNQIRNKWQYNFQLIKEEIGIN